MTEISEEAVVDIPALLTTLRKCQFTVASERDLQEALAKVLTDSGIPFEREFVASRSDRFDFLLPGGVVIEVKTQGSKNECLRQIARYLERADVSAAIAVGTRHWLASMPESLCGKPVHSLYLWSF